MAPERTTVEAIIERMRSKQSWWDAHSYGSLDVVYANIVDDWADELEAAIAVVRSPSPMAVAARLEAAERAYDRLALCSDHRDKADGRCIVCVAEERTRRERSPSPMEDWQDISTAPTDRLILLSDGYSVHPGHMDHYGGWIGTDPDNFTFSQPTRWMPFPKPPSPQDAASAKEPKP